MQSLKVLLGVSFFLNAFLFISMMWQNANNAQLHEGVEHLKVQMEQHKEQLSAVGHLKVQMEQLNQGIGGLKQQTNDVQPIVNQYADNNNPALDVPLDMPLSAAFTKGEPTLKSVVDDLISSSPSDECTTFFKRALDPFYQISRRNNEQVEEPWTSQFAEDFYLFVNFFYKRRGGARGGVYIDVGANHPRVDSDTWMFDKCLGWKGICFEANPSHAERFKGTRTCEILNLAVGPTNGTVEFDAGLEGTGQVTDADNQGTVRAAFADSDKKIKMQQVSLTEVLKHRPGITHIDLLKLDCEGCELGALRGFPWDKVKADYLIVENPWWRLDTREFLTTHGYRMIFMLGPDEMWVRGEPTIPPANHFTMLLDSATWASGVLNHPLYDSKQLAATGWSGLLDGKNRFPGIKYRDRGVPGYQPGRSLEYMGKKFEL